MSHTFPSFQRLLDKAIALEHKRVQLGEMKRKAITQGQGSSNIRPRSLHPRVHQLVLEEDNNRTIVLLSRYYKPPLRLCTLIKQPPLAPRRDLLAKAPLKSPLASSVMRLGITPMLVLRETPTHQLEVMFTANNRLQLATRGSVLPESTLSVMRLLLMVLTLLLVRSLLI
jgi:hypothetical protein